MIRKAKHQIEKVILNITIGIQLHVFIKSAIKIENYRVSK